MRLIDADELKKALAEMWYENNIRITGLSVAELIDDAPTIDPNELELDIDYSIEYDKRPDGISNAKVTITKIEPCKSTEQNVADVPSGDLISRADAICAIENTDCELTAKDWDELTDAIMALPSADRQKGEWIENDALGWKCSKCGIITNINSNFCPCCGARMKDGVEPEPAPVVAYICDRRRCAICRGQDGGCDHTTDIKHAAHFKNVAGQYFERPYMEEEDNG